MFLHGSENDIQGVDMDSNKKRGNAMRSNDILDGKGGSDVLYGGSGMDIYKYRPRDGNDVMVDADGKGAILFDPEGANPQLLAFGVHKDGDAVGQYKSHEGSITYTVNGNDFRIASHCCLWDNDDSPSNTEKSK